MTKNRFCVYLFIGVMTSAVITGCTGIGTGVKTSSEPAVQAAAQSAPASAPAVQAAPAAAPVAGTVDLSRYEKPGFAVFMEDGRLWVFKADSKELAEFLAKGEPARQVIRPGAGPFGLTVKATDAVILDEYMKNWDAAAN